MSAVESDWNKNDLQVACDLKKGYPTEQKILTLCFLCITIATMLLGSSALQLCWAAIPCSLLCSIPILEYGLTITLVTKYPTGWMDGWMNYSRHELTAYANMFIHCFIELNHNRICDLSDLKLAFLFFQITYDEKGFNRLQIRYVNHQTITLSRNSYESDKYLYLMSKNQTLRKIDHQDYQR